MSSKLWAGVDVGGYRKGFHVAIINEQRHIKVLEHCEGKSKNEVLEIFKNNPPRIIAVDSPKSFAPKGQRSRQCECDIMRRVCGIRATPDEDGIKEQERKGSSYYEWIRHGCELYDLFQKNGFKSIECFPTAAWTRWGGLRGQRSRAKWSSKILQTRIEPKDFLKVHNQDERDAIAAAIVAYQHENGGTDSFGEIIVPKG